MSDHFLVVIPADPGAAVPETAGSLVETLADIAGTTEARLKDYGKLQFIDCGENFERCACPSCAAEIPLDRWSAWMENDWHGEDGFHLHRHAAPCCGEAVTLNEIVYYFPQGFATWFASVRNTGREPLTPAEVARLEVVAGLPLRAIAQMY